MHFRLLLIALELCADVLEVFDGILVLAYL